jgi:hypothetical protein
MNKKAVTGVKDADKTTPVLTSETLSGQPLSDEQSIPETMEKQSEKPIKERKQSSWQKISAGEH